MLVSLQDGPDRQYYAVFDGHGGVDAANYAATHLHVLLGQQGALASDPDTAFKEAFTRTDHMFRGRARREVRCFIITPELAGPVWPVWPVWPVCPVCDPCVCPDRKSTRLNSSH